MIARPLFAPERLVMDLEVALYFSEDSDTGLEAFVRERLACNDPGPLYIENEVVSTPSYDLELERRELLGLLRWRSGAV